MHHLRETAGYAKSLLDEKQENVDYMQKEIGQLLLSGQEQRARLKVYLLLSACCVCTITNQKYLNHSHKIK